MSKTRLKLGNCELCGNTLCIEKDQEFFCNSWGCVSMNQIKNDEDNYIIEGKEKLVHGIYHEVQEE